MNASPSIIVDKLVKRFGAFVAVNEASFQIRSGEIFGLLGPNGSGKSTIIRMLCGLLSPSSGSATVAGFDTARESEQVRRHIGYMSQKFSLYNDLTAIENLQFFGGLYGVKGSKLADRIAWAVKMAALSGSEHLLTGELSGGWKQRLALGCAVLHQPQVLFLDEPTAGVDPLSRRQFWDLIHQMSRAGVTVLVTTHYMDEAEYCNRLALIDQGRVVQMGTPSEIKRFAIKGDLLLIECSPLGAGLAALKQAPGVLDVSVFGAALHAVVAAHHDALIALPAVLAEHKVRVDRIEPIAPSLEDAFVSLTGGRALREETAQ